MAHTCNPSTLGGQGGRIMWSRPSWSWWNPFSTKIQKISRVWWHGPVVPATQEAEAGESPESGDRGCSEPRLCHCTPAWQKTKTLSQKKKSYVIREMKIKTTIKYHYMPIRMAKIQIYWQHQTLAKTWRPRQEDREVKRSRPSWPTWWNPVSTKNTKLAECGAMHL